MWEIVFSTESGNHVMPIDDRRIHRALVGCWCVPTNDAGVMVHHSADRREFFECSELPSETPTCGK